MNFPIYKILAGTISGIILGYCLGIGMYFGIVALGVCLIGLSILYFNKKIRYKRSFVFLNFLIYCLLWVSFGIFIVNFQHPQKPKNISLGIKYAIVKMPMEEKTKTFKTILKVRDSVENFDYNVLAYFDKNSEIPECGDLIGFFSDVEMLESENNPFEFDYAEYMSKQGVYCKTVLKKNEFKIISKGYDRGFRYFGSKLREKLLEIYRSYDFGERELSVLEALTLGYKADLDEETITAFQKSGSMHILAVSGLHTGIILLIINFLLKFLNYTDRGRILKFLIIVMLLWLFAAVTGFSPSVCRSALMFSLMAFSNVLRRPQAGFPTLAFSCFILLIINPLLIFNVGFLLSYSAVASILAVMPLMKPLEIKHNFVNDSTLKIHLKYLANYFIGILTVSVAAQVGTVVLSISTFNQFPMYFMLTNIIVIPLSFFIMISAVMMLIFSYLTVFSGVIAIVLDFLLKVMINSVSWIESLPYSCVENIFMSKISSILLYVFLAAFVIYLTNKKVAVLKFSLLIFAVFCGFNGVSNTVKNPLGENIIICNKAGYSCINIFKADTCTVLTTRKNPDKSFLETANKISGIRDIKALRILRLDTLDNLRDFYYVLNGKKYFVLSNRFQMEVFKNQKFKVDCLIISGGFDFSAAQVLEVFSPKEVIFDSSHRGLNIEKIKDVFLSSGVLLHDVKKDGAYFDFICFY
ncbi:MAG: ComEC/Rec2 family competence protein [Bacteroidales bacterium]|nr:ComEC/Rec2 family competence protein [Bacteroidales bacterium]